MSELPPDTKPLTSSEPSGLAPTKPFTNIPPSQEAYSTARPTFDGFGLGHTGGQRGAEILAGLRAELMPSRETLALCRASGRMVAGIILRLVGNSAKVNYVSGRPASFMVAIRRELAKNKPNPVLVELAAGFSHRSLQLAREFPQLRLIEVDLPDVVKEKKIRLERARLPIPPNLEWRAADLGVIPLSQVLEGELVDIVAAEGLTAYFKPADITQISATIRQSLKIGGVFISDINWKEGHKESANNSMNLFRRQAGEFLGIVEDEAAARQLLIDAGYGEVNVLHPAQLVADVPDVRKPVHEYSLLVAAYNTGESDKQASAG